MDYWFIASGIFDDEQRFCTILAAIDPNVLTQLAEVLQAAPVNGKYEFVRQKLIAHFADSEQRKLNRLLSEMPLGDKRPSELFHEMKRVAGNVLGEAALKGLWTQRLPEYARPVIASTSGSSTEYTRIADSIIDAIAPRSVNQITDAPLSELNELKAVIAELKKQITDMPRRSRSHSRNSNRQNYRSRTPSHHNNNANQQDADPELCWYHQTYGNDARNCRLPCRRRNHPAASNSSSGNAEQRPSA